MTIPEISAHFILPGPVIHYEEITTGLINTTYAISCKSGSSEKRYILQSINSKVFPEPENVMENIFHVTGHIGAMDPGTEQLRLIPIHKGRSWLTLPDQTIWRCYPYHENTESFNVIDSPDLAFRAAAAFGRFQAKLSDLDPSSMFETIRDFHNTPVYFSKFETAVSKGLPRSPRRLPGRLRIYHLSEKPHLALGRCRTAHPHHPQRYQDLQHPFSHGRVQAAHRNRPRHRYARPCAFRLRRSRPLRRIHYG